MTLPMEQLETWSLDDIAGEIRGILAEVLEKPVGAVHLDTPLDEGLGIDSLAMIETHVAIEERFGVVMPDIDEDSVAYFRTVKDLVQAVAEQIQSRKDNG